MSHEGLEGRVHVSDGRIKLLNGRACRAYALLGSLNGIGKFVDGLLRIHITDTFIYFRVIDMFNIFVVELNHFGRVGIEAHHLFKGSAQVVVELCGNH